MFKRIILSCFIIFVVSTAAFSQVPDRIGLNIGYGSSALNFENFTATQDGFVAPDVSLVAEWDMKPWLDISAEPGLVHRGYKRDFTFSFIPIVQPPAASQVKMRYFSLPILAKIKPFHWGVSPFVEVGPRLDVLLSREINNAGSYVQQVFEEYDTVTGGASVGLGAQLGRLFPSVNISVSARYNWDAFDSYSDGFTTIKNWSGELWLGITYEL